MHPHVESALTQPIPAATQTDTVRSDVRSARPTVVLTSAIGWDSITARPQHFAVGLARMGWNVLFVDGPLTWLSPLKNRALWPRVVPRTPVRTIDVQSASADTRQPGILRVLSPIAGLPFGNLSRALNHINQRLLALQIQTAMPGPYVLVSMLPGSVDLIPHLHPIATLYDCVDRHAEFPGFVNRDVVNEMEHDLVNVSRAVFATAESLRARMATWHADVSILPNAAELAHFASARTAEVHPLLRDIPSPRVTMVGGIGSWVDQTFLLDLAADLPDTHIVLIGPVETDVSALQARSNIHLLGRQPYAELPRFLAGSDATLVAFRADDPVAQSVNPVKLYEYLAADKEVVATPIPELRKLSDVVWLAENGRDAASCVRRILSGERRMPDEGLRQAFIENHSWTARVQQLDEALKRSIPIVHLPH